MNVYDAVIADVNRCLAPYTPKVWPAKPDRAAREGGKNQLILGSEAAYELGALSCDSVSCLLLTEDEGRILGEDDCPCGRKGKYFEILGRVKRAEVRGCSDTYEG